MARKKYLRQEVRKVMFDFVDNIIQSKPNDWNLPVEGGADLIRARLGAEIEIRIYVDNSDNFGNQASSVLVMQTLIDEYGFSGEEKNVWMVYKADKADETRKKLSILIKGFDASNPVATTIYNDVTINFITVEALAAPEKLQINYGFSGGGNPDPDSIDSQNWFAVNLKTKIFLLLQPYLWDLDGPDEIEYGQPYDQNDVFKLSTNEGAGETFSRRGWCIREQYWNPTEDDWAYYTDADSVGVTAEVAYRSSLAQVLTKFVVDQTDKNVRFMPAYGVKGVANPEPDTDPPYYKNQMLLPPDQVLPTVVSTALGGSGLAENTPAIVVSMNTDMDDASYDSSYLVCKGGSTRSELSAQQSFNTSAVNKNNAQMKLEQSQTENSSDVGQLQLDLTAATKTLTTEAGYNDAQIVEKNARVTWLESNKSSAGVSFYSSRERNKPGGGTTQPITPEALSTALDSLVAADSPRPAVLYLELGSLPKIIFNYVMSLGTFPNVFEGANTAILALNQGKCYLRMKDESWTDDNDSQRYPSAWAPGAEEHDEVHETSWNAADGVTGALKASPTIPANFVPNITLTTNYLRDYYITQDVALRDYYADLKTYYHDPVNGKLGIGLAYMNQAAINIGIPAPE